MNLAIALWLLLELQELHGHKHDAHAPGTDGLEFASRAKIRQTVRRETFLILHSTSLSLQMQKKTSLNSSSYPIKVENGKANILEFL